MRLSCEPMSQDMLNMVLGDSPVLVFNFSHTFTLNVLVIANRKPKVELI